jgi:NitT/TauT family transport system substrate-binding protein
MREKTGKGLCGLVMLAIFSMLLAACRGETPEPLSIATNQWPGYEPLYLARDLGYYGNADVRLVELPSASEVIKAFRSGTVDAAALTLDEALLLVQDDIAVKAVLVMDVSNGADVVMARPEIKSLAGLAGKRVGVESFALGAYMLSRMLEAGGLKPTDIEIVPLTVDQHEGAYLSGKVDAVVTFEPVRTKLLSAGAHILFDSSRIPNEIFDVLVVRRTYLQRHPQQAARLEEAWFRALDYLRSKPDDAAQRMAQRLGISGPEFREALKGLNIPDHAENARLLQGATPGLVPPAQRLMKVMAQNRLLREEVDPARLLE